MKVNEVCDLNIFFESVLCVLMEKKLMNIYNVIKKVS